MSDDLSDFITQITAAAEAELALNRKSMDNHLDESAIVISNLAALRTLSQEDTMLAGLVEAAKANPTA